MKRRQLSKIVEEVVMNTMNHKKGIPRKIPIAVSNRHVHLSTSAVERLFGKGYTLKKLRDLSQPGQYACHETVTLIGSKGKISNVRVLGPARGETQIEISLYDGYTLGIHPPIRDSGDLEGTPSVVIQGPRGQLRTKRGLICAARHIHMHPDDAIKYGLKNGDRVQVEVGTERGAIFKNVLIRVSPKYRLEMHIDIDEANATHVQDGQTVQLVHS